MSGEIITQDELTGLTVDELAEMANKFGEKCQQSAKKTVQDAITSGMALLAAKEKSDPGGWLAWLGKNWNYTTRTAQTYMALGANAKRFVFEKPDSIRSAMSMIAVESVPEDPSIAPRSDRKTGAVEVVQPDDDPTPAPPTNRKTAKGSEKVKEADKPKPQTVVPEIVADAEESPAVRIAFAVRELNQVLGYLVEQSEKKKTAKQLRKLADELDPPTKFVKPDLDQITEYMGTLGDAIGKEVPREAESFFDFYESKGWIVGKVSMKDWRASARKWLREHHENPFGGTGNGSGKTSNSRDNRPVEQRFPTAEQVFRKR